MTKKNYSWVKRNEYNKECGRLRLIKTIYFQNRNNEGRK
jgi:hypothetical protein